jgi:hypothetical protein
MKFLSGFLLLTCDDVRRTTIIGFAFLRHPKQVYYHYYFVVVRMLPLVGDVGVGKPPSS